MRDNTQLVCQGCGTSFDSDNFDYYCDLCGNEYPFAFDRLLADIPPIDWQYIHIGLGCYIEQDNPELNPIVVLDLSPDADEYTKTFQPNSPY